MDKIFILVLLIAVGVFMHQEDTLRQDMEDLRQQNIELKKKYQDELNRRESLDKEIEMVYNKETEGDVAYVIDGEISMYTTNDGYTPSTTMANGEQVHVGAVANNLLPFGTRVRIDGQVYTVKDRTGMGQYVFDIYTDSYDHAIQYGRQYRTVEVLK